jgi:hypothetical protein
MARDATVWDTFALTKKRLGDHGRIASADWPVLDWHENLQLGGPLQT